MEKRDRIILVVFCVIIIIFGLYFDLDYSKIAENGLTLSSIVLAVYIATIIGLINSNLASKMKKVVKGDKTSLGILVCYFKYAIHCSLLTIFISTVAALVPAPISESANVVVLYFYRGFSILGLIFYVENLVFLCFIVRFILNRQIWDE